jgi:thymidylate synthase (FAD)
MLVEKGHESVLEHCSFSVRFIVDRGVSHEIVRHRMCAFSQESTRYVNYGKKPMSIVHPKGLTDIQRIRREMHYDDCYRIYMTELKEGIAPQIARGVLPTSLKTEIVVTANLRQWRHMLKLRTTAAAHPQMREVMVPLLEQLKKEMPEIFGGI